MMKQSTSFAQGANNLLNVLQGYSKTTRLLLVMFLTLTVTTNAWGATLTLNNLGSSLTSESNTEVETTNITATGDNTSSYVINYLQCKKQTSGSSHAMFLAKSANAFISNKTAMPGNIKSVTVYVLTGAANKTTYHCAFSTTECTIAYTNGSDAVNITGGNSNKYTCTVSNAKYFCISLGNANNGQVYKLDVEYEVDTPPSCNTNPTVSAGSHSNVTTTTATVSCSGGITSLGSAGCSIESYGFVYGTSSNPTISNTKVQVGTTYTITGTSFSKELTGLTANTTYYVCPYATNGNGTAYGTQTTFTTLELPKYTVTLDAGPGTCAASITETSAGSGVTLPTPTLDCGDWEFAGWATSSVAIETSSKPATLLTGTYKPTDNIILYAVYQRTATSGDAFAGYEKVIKELDDWSGKYLLSTGNYTATGEYSNKHLTCTNMAPGNVDCSSQEFTLSKVGDIGYSILMPNGDYLGYSSNTNFASSSAVPTTTSTTYLWTPSTKGISNVSATARKISTNDANTDFRPYSNPSSGIVYLYKRVGGSSTTYYHSTPDCGTIQPSHCLVQKVVVH